MRAGDDRPTVTSPVSRAAWESALRSDRNAVVTQSLEWRDAVFATGRYRDASLLYDFPSGRQVVLPLARHRLSPPHASVASWPRDWGVGGPISSEGITPGEATAVLSDVADRTKVAAALRLRHDAGEAWLEAGGRYRVEHSGCYILDLAGGFDHIWEHKFRNKVRTAVRKAERSDLDVEVDRTGRLLGVFSELYEKSMTRWAAAQHQPMWLTRWRMQMSNPTSPRQLALVARHFGKGCAIWVARSKGQPVAAIIVLSTGSYAKGWRRAMDKELAAPLQANELLDRLSIEDACREGYRFFDLGAAEPGTALAAAKEKLGATLQHNHFLLAAHPAADTVRRVSRDVAKKITGWQ